MTLITRHIDCTCIVNSSCRPAFRLTDLCSQWLMSNKWLTKVTIAHSITWQHITVLGRCQHKVYSNNNKAPTCYGSCPSLHKHLRLNCIAPLCNAVYMMCDYLKVWQTVYRLVCARNRHWVTSCTYITGFATSYRLPLLHHTAAVNKNCAIG